MTKRRVFMSVLGSTAYRECTYVSSRSGAKTYYRTKFIQVATLSLIARDWQSNDCVYIFLTRGEYGSEQRNWIDNGHKDKETQKPVMAEGLKSELENLQLSCQIKSIYLENGDTEEQIWTNFQRLYNCLQEGDEVYFDITHGFRSLPMLVLALNNYSKFLKNTQVLSITYGNYEARNQNDEAPIVDLTSVSELQTWTVAASMFITSGNTEMISQLLGTGNLNSLNNFVDEIATCRGLSIIDGETAQNAYKELDNLNYQNRIFSELIDRVKQKVACYTNNEVLNGFRAVQFCIDHRLFQQGYTLLQEFITTYILLDCGYDDWKDETLRNAVSGAMNINKRENFRLTRIPEYKSENEDDEDFDKRMKDVLKKREIESKLADKLFSRPYKKKLSDKVFKNLSQGARNDINHAGIRNSPKSTSYLKDRLTGYFNATRTIFNLSI
ncbi:TIGR02221 family CRISPR-associated protein [Mangrovibacterium sp.]|uniref:TIGR02221 family CRISPR-associated protein n=1 Tax=Mangrovibacterium sp. TaxID=1961364 RepID=UPI003561B94E